jgi:hypothetical protein
MTKAPAIQQLQHAWATPAKIDTRTPAEVRTSRANEALQRYYDWWASPLDTTRWGDPPNQQPWWKLEWKHVDGWDYYWCLLCKREAKAEHFSGALHKEKLLDLQRQADKGITLAETRDRYINWNLSAMPL